MGPIVKELAHTFADKSIRFVTFDFTSEEGKAAAKITAEKLGVEALFAKNAPRTGFALLYDTKNHKVVKKLSAADEVAQWKESIEKALPSS